MSKLDELIKKYCPDGVTFIELGKVVKFLNGRAYKKSELLDEGKYKVLRVGNFHTNDKWYYSNLELPEDKYCNNGDLLYTWAATIGPEIWNGDKVIFHYHIWKLIFDDKILDKKFLYYFLDMDVNTITQSTTKSTMPHVSMSSMNKRIIPIPPLPVQEEIVRILDSFTSLTVELQAELQARKKQYEYYKEQVINMKINTSIQYIPLSKFAAVRDGTHTSPKPTYFGKYLLTSKNVKNGAITFDGAYLISEDDFNAINVRSKVDKWDLLFTMIGTVGEVGLITEEPDFAIKNVGLIKTGNELDAMFLKYYLTSSCVRKYVEENRSKGSQVFLALGKLRNIPIPILKEKDKQTIIKKIASLEKLCYSISDGLPAEIAARQKQYEYYRDKLLTFKELS